jgi:DNA-binding NarL/FixJ family response regulator
VRRQGGFSNVAAAARATASWPERTAANEDDAMISRCDRNGCDDLDLLSAFDRVASLTDRELEVFRLLSGGLGNRIIARRLSVTEATVKAHVSQILSKLGLDGRAQAAIVSFALSIDCACLYGRTRSHDAQVA